MKMINSLLLVQCVVLNASVLHAQDFDSLIVKLPSRPQFTFAAHYERILETTVESAAGSIGLVLFRQRHRERGSCFETYLNTWYEVNKNGLILEWSLSNHSLSFNLGFVPIRRRTCLFGSVGYAIKASYLMTRKELKRTKNHSNYLGVRLEGTAFWINPYVATYMNFSDDFDSFVAFGMGVRL